MKKYKKITIFTALTAILVIVFLEIVLNIFALASPRINQLLAPPSAAGALSHTIPDKRLQHRPNPSFPGHDDNGFRNPMVPAQADIVALGDSQTYGVGVDSEQAWPRQLEPLTDRPVYSMAYGGYGPVHSLLLWDEASALKPQVIIEAFYSGNDLFDAFSMAYYQGQRVDLKSSEPNVLESVRNAEQAELIGERIYRVTNMGASMGGTATDSSQNQAVSLSSLITQHSKLYNLLQRVGYEFKPVVKRALSFLPITRDILTYYQWQKAQHLAASNPSYTQLYDDGQFRTVFTSEYRFVALDLEDPRIAEGRRIALRAIQKMSERAAKAEIRFIVALVPTKELVFQDLWDEPSTSYLKLTRSEADFWNTSKDFLDQHGIEYVDLLPALREQLAAGNQPYQVSQDGHPNEHGHQAIATRIRDYLQQ